MLKVEIILLNVFDNHSLHLTNIVEIDNINA